MRQQLLKRRPAFSPGSWVAGLTCVVLLGASPRLASAALDLTTKDDIVNLMLCYGQGTDAIGDSTRPQRKEAGAAIYAQCFTEDAPFSVWFPGTPFSGPPTVPPIIGPEAWAQFVYDVFSGNGYTFTQHSLTNFLVDVQGNTGTLTAYLDAAHVTQAAGAVTSVAVAHGTYTLTVKQIQGTWKITALALKLINFTPFFP
jgi:SnoaL-like protein